MFTKMMFLVTLVVSLTSSIAFAQAEASIDAQVAAKKVGCAKQFAGTAVTALLARTQCELAADITGLEIKAQTAGADTVEIKKELAHQRMLLDSIEKSLKMLAAVPKPVAVAALPTLPPPTHPTPTEDEQLAQQQQQQQVPMPMMMGAPYAIIEAPGQMVALTKDIPELTSSLRIQQLTMGVQRWLGNNATQARIVILKNGDPLVVTNPSRPGFYTAFYADLNRDGQPDNDTYKGIDPAFLDTVYVATEVDDNIELVFLSPVGNKKVVVSGLPPQTLWGHPVRVKLEHVRNMGRFKISAYDGTQVN